MKSIFYLSIAGLLMLLISCSRDVKIPQEKITYSDTAGLAAFQLWKTQHELQSAEEYFNNKQVPSQQTPVKKVVYKKATNGSMTSVSSNPAKPAKKGWSKAAKGTAIGAGSGAIVGALVSKQKGKGAVIGGVVGAGIGYLIGRDQDKKAGRY